MSSPQVQNTVVAAIAPVQEKKPRKPILAVKYSKVVIANYSIIQMLRSKGLLSDEGVETAYSEIKLFDSVEDQIAFYESFNTSLKDTGKSMKKFVTQRMKPPKAPKAQKAPRAKSTKPRTKKTVKVADDTKVDVVAQLVEAANAPMSPPREAEVHLAPDAPKKEKKPRANKNKEKVAAIPLELELRLSVNEGLVEVAPVVVAETDPVVVAETAPVKEKKARKPRAKKEVAPPPPTPPVQEEEEEEDEEIHTQEIVIGDKTYLIDGDNNIYSVETHDHIGTFDNDKNKILELA